MERTKKSGAEVISRKGGAGWAFAATIAEVVQALIAVAWGAAENGVSPAMAERFVSVDRETPLLLPPDLRDWVPEDDTVYFVLEAVKGQRSVSTRPIPFKTFLFQAGVPGG